MKIIRKLQNGYCQKVQRKIKRRRKKLTKERKKRLTMKI